MRTAPGIQLLKAVNNLLVGNKAPLASPKAGFMFNNFSVDWDEFVLAAREDFRLRRGSTLRGKAKNPGRTAKGTVG